MWGQDVKSPDNIKAAQEALLKSGEAIQAARLGLLNADSAILAAEKKTISSEQMQKYAQYVKDAGENRFFSIAIDTKVNGEYLEPEESVRALEEFEFLGLAKQNGQGEWQGTNPAGLDSFIAAPQSVDYAFLAKEIPQGGIDLDTAMMNMQVKRDGKTRIQYNPAVIRNIQLDGIKPVILNINRNPINFNLLLGDAKDTDNKLSLNR